MSRITVGRDLCREHRREVDATLAVADAPSSVSPFIESAFRKEFSKLLMDMSRSFLGESSSRFSASDFVSASKRVESFQFLHQLLDIAEQHRSAVCLLIFCCVIGHRTRILDLVQEAICIPVRHPQPAPNVRSMIQLSFIYTIKVLLLRKKSDSSGTATSRDLFWRIPRSQRGPQSSLCPNRNH
jgi:hypothetical protein